MCEQHGISSEEVRRFLEYEILTDFVITNVDRHWYNFGVLRDVDTGKVLGLAPNFDNNMALISRGYPKTTVNKNDLLITLFNELINFDSSLKQYIPVLTENTIEKVIKSVGMRVKTKSITQFIINRYNLIDR